MDMRQINSGKSNLVALHRGKSHRHEIPKTLRQDEAYYDLRRGVRGLRTKGEKTLYQEGEKRCLEKQNIYMYTYIYIKCS